MSNYMVGKKKKKKASRLKKIFLPPLHIHFNLLSEAVLNGTFAAKCLLLRHLLVRRDTAP